MSLVVSDVVCDGLVVTLGVEESLNVSVMVEVLPVSVISNDDVGGKDGVIDCDSERLLESVALKVGVRDAESDTETD